MSFIKRDDAQPMKLQFIAQLRFCCVLFPAATAIISITFVHFISYKGNPGMETDSDFVHLSASMFHVQ